MLIKILFFIYKNPISDFFDYLKTTKQILIDFSILKKLKFEYTNVMIILNSYYLNNIIKITLLIK